MLQSILTLICIGASGFWFCKYLLPRFSSNKDKTMALSAFVLAVLLPTINAVVSFFPKPPDEQQIDQIKPMLDCILVVDSVTSNKVTYHFEVVNVGKTKAKNIVTSFNCPEMTAVACPGKLTDLLRDEKPELIPGGHMRVDHKFEIRREQESAYQFTMLVTYNSELSLSSRIYWSDFGYILRDESLTTGNYNYTSTHSGNGQMLPEVLLNRIDFNTKLDSDPGAFTVRVKVTEIQRPTIIYCAQSRLILYDPSIRQFVFTRNSSLAGCSTVYSLQNDTNEWQFVGMTWSNDYCAAIVNTNYIVMPSLKAIEQLVSTTNFPPQSIR